MTLTDTTAPTATRLGAPPRSRLLGSDVVIAALAIVTVTTGLWLRNGGLELGSLESVLTSIGRLSGLYAALAALAGLVLASRSRGLERRYGLDQLIVWHRVVGITTVTLIVVHAVTDTIAWGMPVGQNPVAALIDLVTTQPWMLAALVGTLLFLLVGISSWRRIRNRIAYETWYYIHLTGYLAVLLAFGHQITLGTDIVGGTAGRIWWIALFVATFAWVVWSRAGDFIRSITRGSLYVASISHESPGYGVVVIRGRGLRRTRAHAGQFFHLRFLTPGLWWQTHPFSLSAAPTRDGLRFTVKALGDGSGEILRLPVGTRVLLEGPYGVFTADQAEDRKVVLFGAGAGIGPIRSVLDDVAPHQQPVVIVRGRSAEVIVHRDELEHLVAERGGTLYVLGGPRAWFGGGDPFHPAVLRQVVPDIARRDAFLCGPASFEYAIEKSLRALRVPSARIHRERFGV